MEELRTLKNENGDLIVKFSGWINVDNAEAIEKIREVSKLPISATIAQENIASQKTALKAGFKDVGYTRMSDGRVMKRYLYK